MTVKFTIPPFEKVHTTKETAAQLKVSESFLAKKRVSGGGPKFIKVGRVVRYPESAINEYLSAQLRSSTSDAGTVSSKRDDAAQKYSSHDLRRLSWRFQLNWMPRWKPCGVGLLGHDHSTPEDPLWVNSVDAYGRLAAFAEPQTAAI